MKDGNKSELGRNRDDAGGKWRKVKEKRNIINRLRKIAGYISKIKPEKEIIIKNQRSKNILEV